MRYEWTASSPVAQWKKQGAPTQVDSSPSLKLMPVPRQTWKGFGGCFNELGWKAIGCLSAKDRNAILSSLFSSDSGCGFNYCRLPIGASDYAESWYSHNEQPGDFKMKHFSIARDHKFLLPYIRAAMQFQPELYLFASPWSPPTWMKQPQAYNNGKLVWTPEYLNAYALYFVKFVQEYAKAGIRIDAVHVQNEPNSDQKFPSCLWTGDKMRDFIRDYLGPLFRKNSLDCRIWAGTIERADVNAWVQLILSDEKAKEYIAGVGYQWAGKGAVQRTRMAWPSLPMVQTENECGEGLNSWDYAHYVFDLFHHYISNGVEAYVYWNMVLSDGGESTWGWKQNSMISINTEKKTYKCNPEFYVMKHFAAFVEPGSQVLDLEGAWSANAIAFRRRDGSIVYVIHNPFTAPSPVYLAGTTGTVQFMLKPQSINTIVALAG